MLEGALDLPSFQKPRKTFYNFRAAAVREKIEEGIRRAFDRIKANELEENEQKFTTEYAATVGAEASKVPMAWKEKTMAEFVQKHPLEEETISWWQWQNRGLKNGFKRNTYFTTPVEESVRNPPGEVRRLTQPMTAYEIYNRDFPTVTIPSWFHPIPSSDGVVRILRELK